MEQVASKCYLGLVIQQVIKELGIQRMAPKLYDAYYEAFKSHYPRLKSSHNQLSKIDGKLYQHYEYPIGEKQNLQYYLAYGDLSIRLPCLKNGAGFLKNATHISMLQGFSTNEGAKSKSSRRGRKENVKNIKPSVKGRKRKNN